MFLELCVEKENKNMVNYMISRANNAIVESNGSYMEIREKLIRSYVYLVSRYIEQNSIDKEEANSMMPDELLEKAKEAFIIKMKALKSRLNEICKEDVFKGNSLFLVQILDPVMYISNLINFEISMEDISSSELNFRYVPMNFEKIAKIQYLEDKLSAWIDSYEMEVSIIKCFDRDLTEKYIKIKSENEEKFANIAKCMVVDYICRNCGKDTDKYEYIKNKSADDLENMLCSGNISFSKEQKEYLMEYLINN